MEKIDVLRSKIKARADLQFQKEVVTDQVANPCPASLENVLETPIDAAPGTDMEKPVNVWKSFDISKLRSAGEKLQFFQPELKDGVAIGKIENADIEKEVV
ncbi:hypothetical protein RIF29_14865 [Crotalaria pallida]|uniref:Uncharacterized protein n=1 Tax=Crotalaria pallida TaxID=3830 RepID=A0AAN9IC27_CROPI